MRAYFKPGNVLVLKAEDDRDSDKMVSWFSDYQEQGAQLLELDTDADDSRRSTSSERSAARRGEEYDDERYEDEQRYTRSGLQRDDDGDYMQESARYGRDNGRLGRRRAMYDDDLYDRANARMPRRPRR